jgi:hypothetical protein
MELRSLEVETGTWASFPPANMTAAPHDGEQVSPWFDQDAVRSGGCAASTGFKAEAALGIPTVKAGDHKRCLHRRAEPSLPRFLIFKSWRGTNDAMREIRGDALAGDGGKSTEE